MYPDTQTKRVRIKPLPSKNAAKEFKSKHILLSSDSSSDEEFNRPKVVKPAEAPLQRPKRAHHHDFDAQKPPTAVTSLPSSPTYVTDSYWPEHSAPPPLCDLLKQMPPVTFAKPRATPAPPSSPPSMEEIQNPPSQSQTSPTRPAPPTPPKGNRNLTAR